MTERVRRLYFITNWFKDFKKYSLSTCYRQNSVLLSVNEYGTRLFDFRIKNDVIELITYQTTFTSNPATKNVKKENYTFENEHDCLDIIASKIVLNSLIEKE